MNAIQMKPVIIADDSDVERGVRDTDTGVSFKNEHSLLKRLGSAVFYGTTSFLLMVVCKVVLTKYGFPSARVIGLGQMTATVIILYAARQCGFIFFPAYDSSIATKVWPLPFVYLFNVVFGLSSTKELSLPMLTVLRRFAILMTMLGELYLFGTRPTMAVQLSVYSMIFGAVIAASNDLAFSVESYVLVLLNDFFTAAYGVIMKKKLDIADLGKNGLLFYNSAMMIPFITALSWVAGDLGTTMEFTLWNDPLFIAYFVLSCVLGLFLNYSMMLCTHYNSALTTMVVGCIKNVSITYLGMIIGGDYVFSWVNFLGINVSVVGSLVYSWVTFSQKQPIKTVVPKISSV
ncbi:UDP-sugar transporter UST74c-like [Schistocerca piceifrons]|uniref:UDP-sugar transporter UST74c-like n=1 Tax=Schistocerca piceifrons TaxID=274613 RepID=UPI001F5FB62E|nr:UDP-sugar transporter UST74c-like [Schistocerca piceifrons]